MRIYYLQAEYELGKHKILKVWSRKFSVPRPEDDANEAINVPFSVLEIDEDWNPGLAKAAFANIRMLTSVVLADRLYVDNAAPPQIHLTDTGAIIPITANPNKADWVASVLAGATDAQIDAWFAGNVTTLAQARNVMAMMAKLIARLARQAVFE